MKTLKDDTQPREVFVVPLNVRATVTLIEATARNTYPDHRESQDAMVKQLLIEELSARSGSQGPSVKPHLPTAPAEGTVVWSHEKGAWMKVY